MRARWFIILIISLLVIGASAQLSGNIFFFGARLNIVLVLLIAYSFFIDDFFAYSGLVLLGGFWLRFGPGWSSEILIITLLAFLAYWLRRHIVSRGILMNIILTLSGTFLFYLLINPSFLYHESMLAALEALGNSLLGIFIYELLRFIHGKKTRSAI